jgi:predicted NBD/HSP70 family sugar kinase
MATLGIDIGGSSVKSAILDAGCILATGQSTSYSRPSPDQLIAAIRQAVPAPPMHLDAVGLCVPGNLDEARRTVTLSVNLPALTQIALDELVRRAVGHMGHIELVNDVVAVACDIWAQLGTRGRLLVLTLGTGVGAGVLDDGVPLRVDRQSPGHIGQVDVSLEGQPVIGPDGGAGSLEGYIGAPALAQRYGPDLPAAIANWQGDEVPVRALARAIRICHAIYRPHHVCLAGGIGIHLGHVLDRLKQMISTNLSSVAREGWTLSVGTSDFHAAVGAARIAAMPAQHIRRP